MHLVYGALRTGLETALPLYRTKVKRLEGTRFGGQGAGPQDDG